MARLADQSGTNSNNKYISNHKNLSYKCTHNKNTFGAGMTGAAAWRTEVELDAAGQGKPR